MSEPQVHLMSVRAIEQAIADEFMARKERVRGQGMGSVWESLSDRLLRGLAHVAAYAVWRYLKGVGIIGNEFILEPDAMYPRPFQRGDG